MTVRDLFPFFAANPDLAYLDSAATSQKLGSVIEKERIFSSSFNAPIHRSTYSLAFEATEEFENMRGKVAGFLGAEAEEIAFSSSATGAFNLLANSLGYVEDPKSPLFIGEGDEILLSRSEHNSVLLPFQELSRRRGAKIRFLPMTEEGEVCGWKEAIGEKTKVVAVSRLSNVTGAFAPVREIAQEAHRSGAIVVSDLCQAVAHERTDVKALDIDFAAFSAHKVFGPTGLGFLYGKKPLLDLLPASFFGGSMVESAWEDKRAVYKKAPWKFEAGTQPVSQAIAMGPALDFLESRSLNESDLTRRLLEAASIRGVKILGPASEKNRAPILSFALEGVHPHDVAQFMDAHGAAVRSGHQCAQILHRSFGFPSSTRASLCAYSEMWEVERFLDLLSAVRPYFLKGR
ncbi:MAG: aminotransferase class V-fold PLP-dependent enzyme [Aeriscardovia sp.]|nr:aminotransferase class V-fold PLP-dependent enzyme [Aeriscardovia sp.]